MAHRISILRVIHRLLSLRLFTEGTRTSQMETIQQTINGSPSAGGSSTVTISRNGDLVYKIYVCSTDQDVNHGSDIINECELEIGGQRIDKQIAEWNKVWWELTTPEDKAIGFKCMIGDLGTPEHKRRKDNADPFKFLVLS